MTTTRPTTDRPELLGPALDVTPEAPWLGLRPFTEAVRDYFFGRDSEIKELFERVVHRPLTILFAQSGLGKTSLLRAGVIPQLMSAGYQPILVRLIHDPTIKDQPLEQQVLGEIARVFPAQTARSPVDAPSMWQLFHDPEFGFVGTARAAEARPVLILDQFEEIFTLGASKRPADAQAFLESLSCLIENRPPTAIRDQLEQDDDLADRLLPAARPCKVVLALREDFLHRLERWRQQMPSMMENRFELRLLSGSQAFRAVYEPGTRRTPSGNQPPIVSAATAETIVRLVAGKGPEVPLSEIDNVPPLLSLICEQLNARRLHDKRETLQPDEVSGSTEEVLRDFCLRCFESQPPAVREFVERRLISQSGFRESVTFDTAVAELRAIGVARPEDALRALVDQRLLTIEDRGGVPRVELTHDILAPVISKSRDQWTLPEALKQAEEIYLALGDGTEESQAQLIVRRLFSALCETDSRGRRTRRHSSLKEVACVAACDESVVQDLARKFSVPGCRLLVLTPDENSDETWIEISHESLIANWPPLGQWATREEQSATQFRRLADAVKLFREEPGEPLSGRTLDVFSQWMETERPNAAWADRYVPDIFDEAESFLDFSRRAEHDRRQAEAKQAGINAAEEVRKAAQKHEMKQAQKRADEKAKEAKKLKKVSAAAALFAVLAVLSAIFAVIQWKRASIRAGIATNAKETANKERERAQKYARLATSQKLATHALSKLATDPQLSLLLGACPKKLWFSHR